MTQHTWWSSFQDHQKRILSHAVAYLYLGSMGSLFCSPWGVLTIHHQIWCQRKICKISIASNVTVCVVEKSNEIIDEVVDFVLLFVSHSCISPEDLHDKSISTFLLPLIEIFCRIFLGFTGLYVRWGDLQRDLTSFSSTSEWLDTNKEARRSQGAPSLITIIQITTEATTVLTYIFENTFVVLSALRIRL